MVLWIVVYTVVLYRNVLKMEAGDSFETSVNIVLDYTTLHPDDLQFSGSLLSTPY
jgi:hypothetical protein